MWGSLMWGSLRLAPINPTHSQRHGAFDPFSMQWRIQERGSHATCTPPPPPPSIFDLEHAALTACRCHTVCSNLGPYCICTDWSIFIRIIVTISFYNYVNANLSANTEAHHFWYVTKQVRTKLKTTVIIYTCVYSRSWMWKS